MRATRPARTPRPPVLVGWWQCFGDFLLSFAAGRDVPPPVCLTEPPSLVSAQPFHDWLENPLSPPPDASQRGAV